MARKFLQLQEQYLAGAGAGIGDTTVILKSFKQIDGTDITDMSAVFGDRAYATIEPGKGTREEQIVFTGITSNADGTVSLTGVSSVTMESPYTETPGLTKQHAGGVAFVITNTSGFYKDFITPQNDYDISGTFSFENFPVFTKDTDLDGTLDIPTLDGQFIHLEYLNTRLTTITDSIDGKVDTGDVDQDIDGTKTFLNPVKVPNAVDPEDAINKEDLEAVAIAGAGLASEVQAGLVSFANDTEFNAGTDVDGDGKPLVAKPSQIQSAGINWNSAKSYGLNDIANYLGKIYKSLFDGNLNNNPSDYGVYKDLNKYSSNGIVINSSIGGGSIQNMRFSDDGMYAFTITNGEILRRFPLTEAYKPLTATVHDQTVTLTADDTTMYGFDFNSDGTKLYIIGAQNDKIYQYNLAGAFDLTGITTYDEEYQPNIQLSNPYDIYVLPDDSKLFICDYSTNKINEFTFGTPGDITTLSYSGERFYTALIEATEYGIYMSPDGTKLFMGGASGGNVYSFTLSTPYDITTMSYDNIAFSISAQSANIYGLYFSTDGTKMYTVDSTDTAYQYNLGTAWDLTTASYGSISFVMTAQDTNPRDICFSADGSKMFMVGTINDTIYMYDLSTNWALNTASYSGDSLLVSTQESNPYAIEIAEDGSAIFILGDTKTIYRYELGTANDITTGSFSDSYLFTGDEATGTLVGLSIRNSGDVGYILDQSLNYIRQINFGTSYDPSTITTNWGGLNLITNPESIQFSPDGYQVYLSNNSQCYKYELETPWDLSTIIDKYYTRPTTGDAWTETTTPPALSYSSNSNELGYKFNSMYENAVVKGFKFTAVRGSGSSGGTNYGNITGRLYTLDGSGVPVSVASESGAESFDTWSTTPAVEFEVVFASEVSLASIQDFVLSIQYDTTDSDTMTFSNITPILESESGVEYEPEQLVSNASLGNYNIIEMSPNQEFIYASNGTHIYEFETSEFFKNIWWTAQSSFGEQEVIGLDEGNNSLSLSILAEYDGFCYGWARSTGASVNVDLNGVSMGIATHDSSGSNNYMNFCVPVKAGDLFELTSSDGNGGLYFKSLN